MVLLSDNQVNKIHDLLINRGVRYESLRLDLLDHICCIVEIKMVDGTSFDEALKEAVRQFGTDGLQRTHEATIYLLTLKFRIMKKIMSYIGLIGGIIACSGASFKIMHWPGANILFILGMLLILVLYLPMLMVAKVKETDSGTLKATYITGILGAMVNGVAILFKFMHLPGANLLIIASIIIIALIFLPVYLTHSYRLAENKLSSLAFVAVLFTGVFIFYGLTNIGKSSVVRDSIYLMHQNQIANLKTLNEQRQVAMANTGASNQGLNQKTEELLGYIEGMRTESVMLTQGVDRVRAADMNVEEMTWGTDAQKLQHMLNSKESDFTSEGLKTRIQEWKKVASSAGVSSNLMKNWLCCEDVKSPNGQLSWEEAHFGSATTILSLVTYLDQLAIDVNQRYMQARALLAEG